MKPIDILVPKTNTYLCDGTGRDSYIATNNGGFCLKYQRPPLIIRTSSVNLKKSCGIIPKQVHYFSNGTGRDQHITSTEGGFAKPYKPQETFFCSMLRQYPRMPSLPSFDQRDYFLECQNRRPPQEQIKQQGLYKTQSFFNQRMSIPKMDYQQLFQSDPFLKQIYENLQGKRPYINSNLPKTMQKANCQPDLKQKQKRLAPLKGSQLTHSVQQLIKSN